MKEQHYILEGIRVIEAASMVMVPSAASVLADYGAEVIKVEAPPGGDIRKSSSRARTGARRADPGHPEGTGVPRRKNSRTFEKRRRVRLTEPFKMEYTSRA